MPEITSDLFAHSDSPSQGQHIYTVSEITQGIKILLEDTFGEVWIEAEISNFTAHSSGHFYFSLKDQAAVLAAVMFSRANKDVKFKIENGLKVICFGRIEAYTPRSQYQIIIEKIEPKGIGSLQLALEQLKQKLENEGLFKQAHKRPLPYLPSRIGIVTSVSGAAIKDILKVLDRRFGDVEIIINSVQVQGETAKDEIAQAIKDFNSFNDRQSLSEKIEILIVGRGGGSIEDLWAFNEEIVARAIYNSRIPVISAVGHERDWTIADLVADLRAPTPSVAAELVIPKKEDLKEKLDELIHSLLLSMENNWKLNVSNMESIQKKLALLNPAALIQQHKLKIEDSAKQIYVRMCHLLQLRQAAFSSAIEKLSGLSPLNILSRGYSITFKMPEAEVVKIAKKIKAGDIIKTRLHEGEILSQVTQAS